MTGSEASFCETSLIEFVAKVHVFEAELRFFLNVVLARRKDGVGLQEVLYFGAIDGLLFFWEG